MKNSRYQLTNTLEVLCVYDLSWFIFLADFRMAQHHRGTSLVNDFHPFGHDIIEYSFDSGRVIEVSAEAGAPDARYPALLSNGLAKTGRQDGTF